MSHYLIATIFSFVTACFTAAASWTKKESRSYYFQVCQCLVYAIASYFYGVYPSIVMMLINALRNYLVGSGKYKKYHCIIFCILAVVLGVWSNNRGLVGLLTVLGTVQFTLCSYYLRGDIAVKFNIIVNLTIWIIYDAFILDFFSAGMDLVCVILAIVTIFRIRRDRKV